jgi:cytochrome b6-f complex iron-sulfur subunit
VTNVERTTNVDIAEAPATDHHVTPGTPLVKNRPEKPAAAPIDINKERRRLIWACIWGYLGVNFLMFLRFFFPRALYEPNSIVNIGFPSGFQSGVNQQFLQSNRIWVVVEPGRLFVIFARCTHLGCTPDWLQQDDMFHCPCHGSEYDPEGINFAGPAPRPMDRCQVSLLANGTIQVDTSHLFSQDPRAGVDHFDDPGAYVTV